MKLSHTSIALAVVGMGYIHTTHAQERTEQTVLSKKEKQQKELPHAEIPIYSFEGCRTMDIEIPQKRKTAKVLGLYLNETVSCSSTTRKKTIPWRLFRLAMEPY